MAEIIHGVNKIGPDFSFSNAYEFAMREEVEDRVNHFFGSALTTISGGLHLYQSLSEPGKEALKEKYVAKGTAIPPEKAREVLIAVVNRIAGDEMFGIHRVEQMKKYWEIGGDFGSERIVFAPIDEMGVLLGSEESPFDPFVGIN